MADTIAPTDHLNATIPIQWYEFNDAAPARSLCTDCGVSRTEEPSRCASACQFIKPDYDRAEITAHGRRRDAENPEEVYFGVHKQMYTARLSQPKAGAQWTGITTTLAEQLLREDVVDAVIAVGPATDDFWKPVPCVITDPDQLAQVRGMRMGYAPVVACIEPALASGYRRLAVVAIPCQVYALRALETELKASGKLDELLVIGTPCSDNTYTEHFHEFLNLLTDTPEDVNYLEFCTDYHVEMRFKQGGVKRIPFLSLPLSNLRSDFFPMTCRTCVDYTNSLADITVGYMGGDGQQWLIVRNKNGEHILSLLQDQLVLTAPRAAGKRRGSVAGFIENTRRAAGGLPLRKMPNFMRPIMGKLMPKLGPKGLEFARARIEMKAAEAILHLEQKHPKRARHMLPWFIGRQVSGYAISTASVQQDRHVK